MQLGSELFDQGVLWFKGEEYENAKLYWEDAAKVGNASAMFCLGICYMSSHYYDMDKAIFWFKKAEKAGHKNAKYQLKLLKKDDVAIRKEVADHFFVKMILSMNMVLQTLKTKYLVIMSGLLSQMMWGENCCCQNILLIFDSITILMRMLTGKIVNYENG